MAVMRLDLERTAVLIVDVQQKLAPVMHERERMIEQAGRLAAGAGVLGLDVLVTEQYPQGLGPTVPGVAERLPEAATRFAKTRFSGCVGPVLEHLNAVAARCVVVAGIEAHVCVAQSCLDLAARGFDVAVAWDATASRREADREPALHRLIQAGVMPLTVEAALFELVGEAGGERFKAMLEVVK